MKHIPQTPAKLDLARLNTPLQPLTRLSAALGGPTIWVKRDDLTGTIETGNKIRKLEFVLARAIAMGCDTLISCGGTQSNHCRATAALAARLGLECHLILRQDQDLEPPPKGNLWLDHLLGAHIQIYPKTGFARQLSARVDALSRTLKPQGKSPYFIPTGASDGVGLWGYLQAAKELQHDIQQQQLTPAAVVCATGSGGTQAGLTLGLPWYGVDCPVIGVAVCDNADYFQHKVSQDWRHWASLYQPNAEFDLARIRTDQRFIGAGYGIASTDVFNTIKHVAKTEGIVFDPTYTGKAFYGLLEMIKNGEFGAAKDVIFVHTGGVYGLLAQSEQCLTLS